MEYKALESAATSREEMSNCSKQFDQLTDKWDRAIDVLLKQIKDFVTCLEVCVSSNIFQRICLKEARHEQISGSQNFSQHSELYYQAYDKFCLHEVHGEAQNRLVKFRSYLEKE